MANGSPCWRSRPGRTLWRGVDGWSVPWIGGMEVGGSFGHGQSCGEAGQVIDCLLAELLAERGERADGLGSRVAVDQ